MSLWADAQIKALVAKVAALEKQVAVLIAVSNTTPGTELKARPVLTLPVKKNGR